MTSGIRIGRLAQLVLEEKPPYILFPQQLFQLYYQSVNKGLHSQYPSSFHRLLRIYHSNPSTLSYAANLFPKIEEPINTALKWKLMIRHASAANPLKALSLFQEFVSTVPISNESTPVRNDPFIYASLIKACGKGQAFLEGKSIHCHVIRLGLDYNVNVLNSLVSFYAGSMNLMSCAAVLFDTVLDKSVITVNCMMSGQVKRGNYDVGLSLLVKMLRGCFGSNVKPNYISFVILISGCVEFGGKETGNALHCSCFKMGLKWNVEICNVLIDLYAKFGCIFYAASVFRDMLVKDLISWNTMIWGYVNNGNSMKAFSLFKEMKDKNIGVDRESFSCLLSACAACKDLCSGRMIHAHVKAIGMDCDVSVGTALIKMYAKCRKVKCARKLFDDLPKQNIEFWNSMIHVYVEDGLAMEALKLFDQINSRNLQLDEVTVLGLIMACRDSGELNRGIHIHCFVESNDHLRGSLVLGNALIDMYAKCGSMAQARAVFDGMSRKDVISWTSIIVGYAINGEGAKSLDAFEQMCAEKIVPNSVTFIGVLSACDHAGLVDDGRRLYDAMQEVYNIKPQIEHCGCMVDMLARAGRIDEVQIFIGKMPIEPNTLIWRMLINACSIHGHIDRGLNLVSGLTEINTSNDTADHVITSKIFAEAGRWDNVISHRSHVVEPKDPKVAGKSSVCYLTE